MTEKILIIEDEYKYLFLLKDLLTRKGFFVYTSQDGYIGFKEFKTIKPDLVILDIFLPQINGYELVDMIREISNCPILMLISSSEEQYVINSYFKKLNGYIYKPSKDNEVLEIINKALLSGNTNNMNELIIDNLKIDLIDKKCYFNENEALLTNPQFSLLLKLVKNKGIICTRESLIESIDTKTNVNGRVIDTYIKEIRKKIWGENNPIKTIYGVGYKYE